MSEENTTPSPRELRVLKRMRDGAMTRADAEGVEARQDARDEAATKAAAKAAAKAVKKKPASE